MTTPTIKKAPPFDAERMERRSGSLRSVPVRVDKVEAAELAAVAATAWSEAKAEAKEAAEALKRAKTADKAAQLALEEALEEVEDRLAELKTGWEHIDAEVERHMVWAKNVVREVRLDPGFEGVLFDEYAMDPEDRHDLLASPKAKKPEAKTDREVGDRYMALRGFVETAWKHRSPADRDAFITDVMGYGSFDRSDVEAEVDGFLAERAVEAAALVNVAQWIVSLEAVVGSEPLLSQYAGDTHGDTIDRIAGDAHRDIRTVMVDGVECEVDLDQIRDAVEITVTRGQRDLVVSKLEDANGLPLATGKTPKTLAKDTGLSIDRVGKLLASAKTDGLVDKPKGRRSWISLPAPVLPPLDPDEVSLAALNREDAKPTGEFEGEEFDAAMLVDGPARERVIAKLVAHLPASDAKRPSSKTPRELAAELGVHQLDVGRLLLWAHERSLVHKVDGRNSGGWVRLPAAVVAEPAVVEDPAPEA